MESLKRRAESHFGQLESERNQWCDHWQELSKYIQPRRGKFLLKASRQGNKGKKQNDSIIDSTATVALRTLASGMMTGATPHSRPWFRLVTPDPEMMDNSKVRAWLELTEQRMRHILTKSNFYNAQHIGYEEMGLFGIGAMVMVEDMQTVARFYPLTAGEFYIAHDERGLPSVFGRDMDMTVRALVHKFGIKNVSTHVRNLWDRGNYETEIRVRHYISPNSLRDIDKKDNKNMPFSSIYYEVGGDGDKLLSQSGFKKFPIIAPRWHALDDESYGRSPAMDALGDVKQLQLMQKRKAQAIGKMVNPAMVAPSSLRNQPTSINEGSITYADEIGNDKSFRPAHEVNMNLSWLLENIQDVRDSVNRAFFADLFLMLTNSDRREITAREIDERHEEKMLALGPVIERLGDESHTIVIDNLFELMLQGQLVPEPPEELQGQELKVEYISILAQAQEAFGAVGIERTANFVSALAQVFPHITDKLDADEAAEQYARMNGVPVKVMRSNEDLKLMRDQRAKQEQMQQAAAMAQGAAEGAKNLASADMSGDNALTRLAANG